MSAASVLDVQQNTDKKGKKYYKFELLSRTGQCHSLLAASTGSWLVRYSALQLLCQQSACRNVFGNLSQRPGSQVILHPEPCQQQRDGEEASQPIVCVGPYVEASLGPWHAQLLLCSRWQAPPCCKGVSPLTDSALSGVQLMAMRAAGTS